MNPRIRSRRGPLVAAAIARKALFYQVEAIDEYVSPVASKECIVNSRGVAIDCARAMKVDRPKVAVRRGLAAVELGAGAPRWWQHGRRRWEWRRWCWL